MLGKTLKYDIKFGRNSFLLIAGAIVLFGALARIFGQPFLDMVGIQIIAVLGVAVIACAFTILVFQNFNRSIFGAEGYLTLTLPVKRYKLMLSKVLSTLLWFNVVVLSFIVMSLIMYPNMWGEFLSALSNIYNVIQTVSLFFGMNLLMVNALLFLYLLSSLSHISIAGKRPGWIFGGISFAAANTLEIVTIVKLLFPLFNGWALYIISTSADPARKVQFTTWDVIKETIVDNPNLTSYSLFDIHFEPFVGMIVFSALAWLVTWYCLKKRVDLP